MTTQTHIDVASTRSTSSFGLLAAIVLLAAIAPAVLLTAPALASQLASQWQLSPAQIGDLFSFELGAMSLASLPAWWWLRRIDWRRAALAASLLFVAANLGSAFASGYSALLALRFVSGLAGGSLMILCMSSAASTANPGRVYGLWVMGQLVVGAIGLAVLPKLFAAHGIAAAYLLLAGLMGLCLPLTRWLPAAASQSHTQQASAGANGFSLRAALGILAVLAFYVGLGAVWTFIGGIASQAGLSADESGDILAVASLLGIAGSGCASLLGERRGRGRAPLLLAGYTMMLAATLLLLGQPQLARFATAALLLKFSWTFALPYILASLATLDPSGRLMTATNLVIGGGLAIGPAIAGRLLEASGGAFHSVLLGAAACTALSLGLILAINRRPPA